MSAIPPGAKRVELNTKSRVNERIKQKTIENVSIYIDTDKDSLTTRLKQLNSEWDTERVLEANAAFIIFISSLIGYISSPYWFIVTGIISLFLLQHAVQGWCPPLPIIRRLGIRTPKEINDEKIAIMYLRGDFTQMNNNAEDIINSLNYE